MAEKIPSCMTEKLIIPGPTKSIVLRLRAVLAVATTFTRGWLPARFRSTPSMIERSAGTTTLIAS